MPKNRELEAKKLPNRPGKIFETHRKNRKKKIFWSKKNFFGWGQKIFSGRFGNFWASKSRFFGIFGYFSPIFWKIVKIHQKYLFWGTFGVTMVKVSGNFLKNGKIPPIFWLQTPYFSICKEISTYFDHCDPKSSSKDVFLVDFHHFSRKMDEKYPEMPKNRDLEAQKCPNRPEKIFWPHQKKFFFDQQKFFFRFFRWVSNFFSGRFGNFLASKSRFFGIFGYFLLFFVHFSSKIVKIHQKYAVWSTFWDRMVKISGNFRFLGQNFVKNGHFSDHLLQTWGW